MFKSLFLPILAAALFIILVGLLTQGKLNGFLSPGVTPTSNTKILKIGDTSIDVEIAKTNEERAKGLGGRDNLDKNSGMLFIFNSDSNPTFWMKDTKIPLDIIWINDNKIVGIDKNVKPEIGVSDDKLQKYPSPTKVDYVLEVNAGFSDTNNIKVGDLIDLVE